MNLQESLRSAAGELRKLAAIIQSLPLTKKAAELDPQKVRDFLVFMGSARRMYGK